MKKITALAALSVTGLTGLAVSATPAQAASTSFGQGGAMQPWNVTTAELCHRDLAGYPLVGPAVDHTTGACEAIGDAVDHPQF